MRDELITAWRTNCRINHMILDSVSDEGLDATLSTRGGRGVRGELAHIHTIRVWHIEKRAKDLAPGLVKYSAKDMPSRTDLRKALKATDKAVQELLVGQLEGAPKRRGFKRGVFTTLGYFVSHEAHHRGRILLTLKVSKNTIDRDVAAGIWAWDQV